MDKFKNHSDEIYKELKKYIVVMIIKLQLDEKSLCIYTEIEAEVYIRDIAKALCMTAALC